MAVRLGDTAPDFTADTTQGEINFHEWLGDSLGRAVQPPEGLHAGLHDRARLRRQDQAGVRQAQRQGHRPVGRPGRRATSKWEADIEETQGTAVNFPMIGDPDRKVADLYDMIHPNASDTHDRALGVRHRAGQEGQADAHLPGLDRPQLRRDPARHRLLQLTANYKVATPANWKDGDDVIIGPAVSDEDAKELFPTAGTP